LNSTVRLNDEPLGLVEAPAKVQKWTEAGVSSFMGLWQ